MSQYVKAAIQINTSPAKLVAQYTIITTLRNPAGLTAVPEQSGREGFTWHVAYWRNGSSPMPSVTMMPAANTDHGYALEPEAYQAAQSLIESELNRGRSGESLVFLFG